MVQIWYPAQAGSSAPPARYMDHPEELALAARLDVVVGIDQPYAASGVAFPDSLLIAMDPRMSDPARPGHPAIFETVIPFLAADVSFTLDKLAALNQSDPNGIVTGRLDLQRAGLFGVSLGGIDGSLACVLEPRLRACLMMDAYMPLAVVQSGLPQPAMWLSRDAATMQREGWTAPDIDETQTTMRAAFNNGSSVGYLVLLPGMFHANFTDAPLFSPLASLLGLSGPFDPQRAYTVVNTYKRWSQQRRAKRGR